MKKLTAIFLSGLVAALGPAFAQNVALPAASGTATAPPVKDFKAARELELDRTKFNLGAMDKLQKCLAAAKVAPDLASCNATYRGAVLSHLASLKAQGKFAAAYGVAEVATKAPTAQAKPTVAVSPSKK